MKLTVWLPSQMLLEEEVIRIKAEAENGWFGLLPKHVDFVTALVPGVMTFHPTGKPEEYLAIDQGILVSAVRRFPSRQERRSRNQPRSAEGRRRTAIPGAAGARESCSCFRGEAEADLVRHLMETEKNA